MKLPPPTTVLLLTLPIVHASLFSNLKDKLSNTLLPGFLRGKLTSSSSHSALLSLHKSLIEVPSITGDELSVAEWLSQYLISKNFTVETQRVGSSIDDDKLKKRENVFAYLGQTRETHTLLTSHIDTVPPFLPYKETSNAIYGRGSCDAKASVAAQITAVIELISQNLLKEGDISLLYVVGEEVTGDGMQAANLLLPPGAEKWKAVIFGEPTEGKLAIGHKGIAEFEIVSVGRAAHSGYPQLGINANENLVKALWELGRVELPTSDRLGNSTVNIGVIEGGVAANVVPAKAKAVGSVRVAGDLEETVKAISRSVGEVEGVTIDWLETPHYGPVELDYDVEGFQTIILSYGTDVHYLQGTHKKYLYGPGSILVAHGDNEHVLKKDLYDAVEGYKKLVLESLNPTRRPPAVIEEVIEEEVQVEVETLVSKSATVVEKGKEKEKEKEKETVVEEAVKEESEKVSGGEAETEGEGEKKNVNEEL